MPRITGPQVYPVAREMLPRERFGPEELLRLLEAEQLRNQRATALTPNSAPPSAPPSARLGIPRPEPCCYTSYQPSFLDSPESNRQGRTSNTVGGRRSTG